MLKAFPVHRIPPGVGRDCVHDPVLAHHRAAGVFPGQDAGQRHWHCVLPGRAETADVSDWSEHQNCARQEVCNEAITTDSVPSVAQLRFKMHYSKSYSLDRRLAVWNCIPDSKRSPQKPDIQPDDPRV